MKHHRYRVTVEYLSDAQSYSPLIFEANSHDEIFSIVELVQESEILEKEAATAFVVGQKLFGEIIMENRGNPLFSEFWPHFLEFVKKLKGFVKK